MLEDSRPDPVINIVQARHPVRSEIQRTIIAGAILAHRYLRCGAEPEKQALDNREAIHAAVEFRVKWTRSGR